MLQKLVTIAHMVRNRNKSWRAKSPRHAELLREGMFVSAERQGDRTALSRMARSGAVIRLDRGFYQVADAPTGPHFELAAAAFRRPDAVICLTSALAFHGLTDQLPHAIDLGLPAHGWAPRWDWPRIEVVYLAQDRYPDGITVHQLDGVAVRVTDIPRTIADCWRFEERVGRTVVLEGTKSALVGRQCSLDAVIAHLDRYGLTERVMPFLECIVA